MKSFKQPPVLRNEKGELRKIGFELEFAHVGVDEAAKIIQEIYGGQLEKEHRFSQKVIGTSLGDFNVEVDLRLLTEKTYLPFFEKFGINLDEIIIGGVSLEEKLEGALESLMTKFFPYEVATPPVTVSELAILEPLRQALHEHHAEGTEAFPTNAFGTHINAEVPGSGTGLILRYLRAFLLLYPWLLEAGHTDFMRRRMTTFIDPFPEEYTLHVLQPEYKPDLNRLIEDYNQHNPDRNRPLDLYPLFAALKPAILQQYPNLGKVKPRKAFHYRLPNSCISRPDWSLSEEWNNWVVIEELANDPEKITGMSKAYFDMQKDTLLGFENKWAKETTKWLS
jgi:hypothetical protein